MNEIVQIIIIIVSTLIIIIIANIIHELGHAIPALLFSRSNVKIVIGTNNEKISQVKIKKVTFLFRGINFIFSATDYNSKYMKPAQQIAAYAGGPVISFIFGESLSLISKMISNENIRSLVIIASFYFVVQFIMSIVPLIYPKGFLFYQGFPSDGFKIITVLKNNRRYK